MFHKHRPVPEVSPKAVSDGKIILTLHDMVLDRSGPTLRPVTEGETPTHYSVIMRPLMWDQVTEPFAEWHWLDEDELALVVQVVTNQYPDITLGMPGVVQLEGLH